MDSSDEDKPLARKTKAKPNTNGTTPMDIDKPTNGQKRARTSNGTTAKSYKEDDTSDSDQPLKKKKKRTESQPSSSAKKPVKGAVSEDDDDEIPLVKKHKATKAAPAAKKAVKKEASDDDDDEIPLVKKHKIAKAKPVVDAKKVEIAKAKLKDTKSTTAKKLKQAVKEEEQAEEQEIEEEEEEYRWWENQNATGDGSKKWTTLAHNGVLFPPLYAPFPKGVGLIYDGTPVTLPESCEEIASFYGAMMNSKVNVENPTFNANFFDDFRKELNKKGHGVDKHGKTVKIEKFAKCDFTKIHEHFEAERAAKKALPGAEKKLIKAKKDEDEKEFTYCLWDGRRQKVGNFRVEPPGLFRGRGDHPKTGRVKKRVMPEQITINIGKEAIVPPAPEGHKWKEIKHDHTGTWLATWQENINGAYKYVMLAANSDVKGQSDYKKFEKARELEKHIGKIRRDYEKNLSNEVMADRQLATAVYLIDKFALRAGNEKGDDEADTVGCCSLKYEHVTLKPPHTVIFDFLGKDSIRFYNEFEVAPQVMKNLRIFKKDPKKTGDDIFDRVTTSLLNKHLSNYMTGLTAKVFRTYNASRTMSDLLQKMKKKATTAEMVLEYNAANREVAIICNHKRTVGAGHEGQMEKMQDRINALRFQQWRTKQMMLDLEPKLKKSKGAAYFELPEDLDEEWVLQHHKDLVEETRDKIKKKFEKENEKLEADGEKPQTDKELKERLGVADELEKKFRKENKTKKVEAEGKGPTVEKLEGSLDKLKQRIDALKLQAEDKEGNKEVALGTSKINYIDPRLTVVFSKKFDVPIEKMFSKTLREKFDWAIKSVDENWTF